MNRTSVTEVKTHALTNVVLTPHTAVVLPYPPPPPLLPMAEIEPENVPSTNAECVLPAAMLPIQCLDIKKEIKHVDFWGNTSLYFAQFNTL